jgi:hypothetical protein
VTTKATGKTNRARGRAKQAGHSTTLEVLARVGLSAYAVVHLLIGWLALKIAWATSASTSADSSGACDQTPDAARRALSHRNVLAVPVVRRRGVLSARIGRSPKELQSVRESGRSMAAERHALRTVSHSSSWRKELKLAAMSPLLAAGSRASA